MIKVVFVLEDGPCNMLRSENFSVKVQWISTSQGINFFSVYLGILPICIIIFASMIIHMLSQA